jgi:hypothetical protein
MSGLPAQSTAMCCSGQFELYDEIPSGHESYGQNRPSDG